MRTLRSIFPCSGFVLWLALSSAASAQTAEELEEARATFAEGVELSRAGRWAAAAQRFRRVHAVRATPAVKFNLGLALVRSGREQQGERYLRAALNSGELDGESSARARRELNRISSSSRSASSRSAQPPDDRTGDPDEPDSGTEPAASSDGGIRLAVGEGGQPFHLDVHAGVAWWGLGFMSGARFGIPVAPEGVIAGINDALYISLGADFYWVRDRRICPVGMPCTTEYGAGLGAAATLQWVVLLDATWSVFVELGGNFFVHPRTFATGNFRAYEPGYFVVAAAGARLRVNEWLQLTARLGIPYSTVGATFDL